MSYDKGWNLKSRKGTINAGQSEAVRMNGNSKRKKNNDDRTKETGIGKKGYNIII